MSQSERIEQILQIIDQYPLVEKILGKEYLSNSLKAFKLNENGDWYDGNPIILNYLYSMPTFEFIPFIDKLFRYYSVNHEKYFQSKRILRKLGSNNWATFQGLWSELIWGYYLESNKESILKIEPESKNGKNDFLTIKGSYEVTFLNDVNSLSLIQNNWPLFLPFGLSRETERKIKNKFFKKKRQDSSVTFLVFDVTYSMDFLIQFSNTNYGLPFCTGIESLNSTKTVLIYFKRNLSRQDVSDVYKVIID